MANIALVPSYVIKDRDLAGLSKTHVVEVTLDPAVAVGLDTASDYSAGGVTLSVGKMGFKRITSISVVGAAVSAGVADGDQFAFEWDGDKLVPKIAFYGLGTTGVDSQPLVELADGAAIPAVIILTLLIRGR